MKRRYRDTSGSPAEHGPDRDWRTRNNSRSTPTRPDFRFQASSGTARPRSFTGTWKTKIARSQTRSAFDGQRLPRHGRPAGTTTPRPTNTNRRGRSERDWKETGELARLQLPRQSLPREPTRATSRQHRGDQEHRQLTTELARRRQPTFDGTPRSQPFNFSSCRAEFVSSCKFRFYVAEYLHQSNHVRVLEHAFNTLSVEIHRGMLARGHKRIFSRLIEQKERPPCGGLSETLVVVLGRRVDRDSSHRLGVTVPPPLTYSCCPSFLARPCGPRAASATVRV